MNDGRVLILGGGIAGATAAVSLAGAGVPVTLVEKDDFLGGFAARLACKALDSCQKCNGCLAEPRLAALMTTPGIDILRRAQVRELTQGDNGFLARVAQRPAYIDPERCTGCGICLQKCPAAAEGALRRPLLVGDRPPLAIDPAACLYFRDGRSTLCQDICPEEAIDFGRKPGEIQVAAKAVVLATGFAPYPAGQKERLGYGIVPNVVTAMELEAMLRDQGAPRRPSDGQKPAKVAFIQCVGSRERLGHNYCSRVCCGYALRLGRSLKHRHGTEVTVFYMDLQSFGQVPQEILEAARRELNLVRSMPYDVMSGEGGRVLVEYQAQSGQPSRSESFDMLALSVGMTPGADNPELARGLGAGLSEQGFLRPGTGIFVAGAACRPLDVAESVASAGRAALDALRYLEAK